MKSKVLLAVLFLSYVPVGVAGNKAEYPNEKVAEFLINKLDVTSLPSGFWAQKAKGRKTIADYGFTAQTLNDSEAIIEADGVKKLVIKILDEKSSGIYVCVGTPEINGVTTKTQSVILLKMKDSSALLKGRESFREFAACPIIGGSDSLADSYGG
jgi:inorganic pyrophosphatase